MRSAKEIVDYAASLTDPSAVVEVTIPESELLIRHCFDTLSLKNPDLALVRDAKKSIREGTATLHGHKLVLKHSGEVVFANMLNAVESKESQQ